MLFTIRIEIKFMYVYMYVKSKPEVVWKLHEGGITDLQSFNKLQANINIRIYLLLTTQYATRPTENNAEYTESTAELLSSCKGHVTRGNFSCNATMTNKKPFKLQRGCYTRATCLASLRKVEGRSTFPAARDTTIAVAKWGLHVIFFLQLATQRLLRCKLQEKLLRVTWP